MSLERRIWNIGSLVAVLLALVSLRIGYWQLLRGDDLLPAALNPLAAAARYLAGDPGEHLTSEDALAFLSGAGGVGGLEQVPQPVIQRAIKLLETISRGSIYDRNGRLLAGDRLSVEGERIRFYSEPSLAHVIGYVSGFHTGVAGLERSYNTTLLGLNRLDSQVNQILHRPITGSDLYLTIDSRIQRAAENALQGQAGSLVVLDAHSGAVLAMANAPRFDPNRVREADYLAALASCPGGPECRAPFLNRATQALYIPGSTWKTVSLIAALDTGQVGPETVFDFGEPRRGEDGIYYVYVVDGGEIPDPNHAERRLNLEGSYAKSANAAFARIGHEMPPETLLDYAARLGFGAPGDRRFQLEIESSPSQVAQDPLSLFDNNWLRAVTAIGQGELLATPLNMAMVALAVYNDGDLPLPYFVERVGTPSGAVHTGLPNRQVARNLMRPETAQLVRRMMVATVASGSGGRANLAGLTVGGKTGTAQVGGNQAPHAWFMGFAEQGERAVVIAVVVENGGEGSQVAAPLFAQVAQVALGQAGQVVEEIVPTPIPPEPTATPEPEPPAEEPAEAAPEEAPAEPTATPAPEEPVAGQPPPPDIPRDPNKKDITEGAASCPVQREIPEGTGQFIWPSQYQALSGDDFREGHPGIDLSAPSGSAVFAADTGLVVFAGWTGVGYGNTVMIDHGNGYRTLYAHLSQVSTYCGARVEKGKLIGLSGSTGNSSGPHLHFEVRVPGGFLHPLKVLPLP